MEQGAEEEKPTIIYKHIEIFPILASNN